MEEKVRLVRFSHLRRAMLTHELPALKGLKDGIGASGRGSVRASGKARERQVLYAWTAMNGFSPSVGEFGGIGLCWMGH